MAFGGPAKRTTGILPQEKCRDLGPMDGLRARRAAHQDRFLRPVAERGRLAAGAGVIRRDSPTGDPADTNITPSLTSGVDRDEAFASNFIIHAPASVLTFCVLIWFRAE